MQKRPETPSRSTPPESWAQNARACKTTATSPRPSSPNKDSLPPLETPEQVADAIDAVIQPRFQENAGAYFGMERILIGGPSGIYSLDAERVPKMKTMLRRVAESQRKYAISFLSCVHKPGKYVNHNDKNDNTITEPYLTTLIMPGNQYYDNAIEDDDTQPSTKPQRKWEAEQKPVLEKAVLKVFPELKKGKSMNAEVGKWFVTMRPVRANKASCLGCHKGAKKGDTLGVMVYSISRTKEEMKKKRFISL